MRDLLTLGLAILLAGCSEYDVIDDVGQVGEPNPPEMESEVQVDRVRQSTVAAVDVLWVVDNSGSMYDEQVRLATNFDAFMGWFLGSGLDYHIGVVTTDVRSDLESGRLQAEIGQPLWIDNTTADPVTLFATMAMRGTSGDSTECGRDAVFLALDSAEGRAEAENAGFYRPEASLAVIVISDEDDFSSMPLNQFITWFAGQKSDSESLSFSSIVGPESSCVGATQTGLDYLEVTRTIGGVEWSICDADWTPALDQLGIEAAGLRREFFLTKLPVVDTLHAWVEVEGEVVSELVPGDDYEYDPARNSVRILTLTPEPLAEVVIEYVVRSTAWPEEPEEAAE